VLHPVAVQPRRSRQSVGTVLCAVTGANPTALSIDVSIEEVKPSILGSRSVVVDTVSVLSPAFLLVRSCSSNQSARLARPPPLQICAYGGRGDDGSDGGGGSVEQQQRDEDGQDQGQEDKGEEEEEEEGEEEEPERESWSVPDTAPRSRGKRDKWDIGERYRVS